MLGPIRRLAVGVLVSSLGLSGLSYAGTGSPNPVRALVDAVTPDSTGAQADVDVTTSPSPTPTPADTAARAARPSPKPDRGVERSTSGCPEGFEGTHGEYVRQAEDKREAARSDCGKPVVAVRSPKPDRDDEVDEPKPTRSPKPPRSPRPTRSPEVEDANDDDGPRGRGSSDTGGPSDTGGDRGRGKPDVD